MRRLKPSAKSFLILAAVIVAVSGCTLFMSAFLDLPPPSKLVKVEKNVMVEMRDGVRLATDVYKPVGMKGPLPVVLARLPYDKNNVGVVGRLFAERGYIYVIQDCRACFASEGDVFVPMVYDREDGMDTVEWIAEQEWFDGNLGTWGPSYLGITQWAIAYDNPYHKCAYQQITTSRLNATIFLGGAFSYRLASGWTSGVGKQNENASPVPLGEAVDWETEGFFNAPLKPEIPIEWEDLAGKSVDELSATLTRAMGLPEGEVPPDTVEKMIELMAYPGFTEYADAFNYKDRYNRTNAPALMVAGWYDIFIDGQLMDFEAMRANAPGDAGEHTRIIIGPWGHASGAHPDAPRKDRTTGQFKDFFIMDWYEYWLKGKDNGVTDQAPIKLFVMGKNQWRDEYEWPLERTEYTKFYLHGGGDANSINGDGVLSTEPPGDEPPDEFAYDPRDPVPTMGGANLLENVGPKDQAEVEKRDDVLVFTSVKLDDELEITGPIEAVIYAASSAVDTDFTVKLCDVYPDGTSLNLQEGIIRARYRDSLTAPSLIEPGKVYEYHIKLWPTSNCFLPGHRIRIQVSSSSFPRFDRNANAGGVGGEMNIVVADQTIYHDRRRPSHLLLPVIP